MKLLFDVLQAIEDVSQVTEGVEREVFLRDRTRQLAAERCLEIMGEALNRLSRMDPELFAKVENAHKVIGLRNILAHGYDVVDYRILWTILVSDLSQLERQMRSLLAMGA